jgi:DinB superfamily
MTNESRIPDAAGEPAAYVEALLSVLGDRAPLEVLEMTPSSVSAIASDLPAGELDHAPAPGEWSARDVLGHLLDVEVVYGFRMRLTLTEDGARYPGYDEKRWAALPKPGFAPMLDAFAALRRVNLHLLRTIPRAEWSRAGHHGEQGPDPFDLQVRKLAGHDLAHLEQLERAARARTA